MQYIRDIRVIGDVAHQKESGGDERRHHAVAMRRLVLPPDEIITGAEENRAQAVEAGIYHRQIGEAHRSRSNRRSAARSWALTCCQSMPSPPVSNTPRSRPSLSTRTKKV